MKYLAITQVRSGSSRLPNKVLKEVSGKTLLEYHIERLKQSKCIDQVLIATTTAEIDNEIVDLAHELNVPYYRGSEEDVLDRFYQAAKIHEPTNVIRLTSDCPLIDPGIIDQLILDFEVKEVDYVTNALNDTFPDGLDVEVMTFEALEMAWHEATKASEREHVTPYILENCNLKNGNRFKAFEYVLEEENYSDLRMTVDEPNDFEVIKHLINKFGGDKVWKTYADYLLENDSVRAINQDITRNEGFEKSIKKDQEQ